MKPMSPFLQHRQANMRKMKVKSPEKETATTASEEDQESSLRGVPSAGTGGGARGQEMDQGGQEGGPARRGGCGCTLGVVLAGALLAGSQRC